MSRIGLTMIVVSHISQNFTNLTHKILHVPRATYYSQSINVTKICLFIMLIFSNNNAEIVT